MTNPYRKILIVLHGAIGDVVRGLSLAVRIKKEWPDSFLCWAVEPRSYELVRGHSAVDKVFLFDRPKGLGAYVNFIKDIRRERFDLVLGLQRHLKSGVTSFLAGAPRRIGFHPNNAKEFNWLFNTDYIDKAPNYSSKIHQYHLFGDKLGLNKSEPFDFGFEVTTEERQEINNLVEKSAAEQGVSYNETQKKVICIIGLTWPSRYWGAEKYAELINSLNERNEYVFCLIGSKSEAEMARSIIKNDRTRGTLDLTQKTSLRQLFSLFKESSIAIGSDSGPMHLAAAVGLPVISIFGSTSPKRSAPYGYEHFVLQSEIGCSPCYRRECPGLDTLCMKSISSEEVLIQMKRAIF